MNHWMEKPWLHRYAILLAVCTLLLVAAGASVTSNQAGLSVPDWPLSYGKVMPEMKGGVFYEHGHRMIATLVGFLTVIMSIWLWRVEDRRWMRYLGFGALGAVILQGVLGGMTVKYMLPKPVSISHACLAQLFFSTTVAIAIFTSPSWKRGPAIVEDSGWPSMRTLAFSAPVLVLVQLALGAGYRHRAFTVMPHVIGAIFVTGFLITVAVFVLAQFGSHSILNRTAWAMMGITIVQVVLGIVTYLARLSGAESAVPSHSTVLLTILHVATGALTMACAVALAIQVRRNVHPHAKLAAGSLPAVS
jgi:cytochrome c oxidase assembly protein subunit 15